MAMANKMQRNYRLPPDLVTRIQEYAVEHGISETEGAIRLLTLGLERNVAKPVRDEEIRMLGEHIRDLRETVSTLRGQLTAKDVQITHALQVASNAQLLEGVKVASELEESGNIWDRIVNKVRGK